jgi:luciferase family oxidoreductase group 1
MTSKTNLPLSVLDLVPLTSEGTHQAYRNSLELVQVADRLGYTRYWFAEHHNLPTVASTTPEILIALAAERTERIHVGSGGVMLPNHSPLKVAETFKMLEALHPGRIDLGLGRAPGTDPATARILRGARGAGGDQFPAMLEELLEFGERSKSAEEPRGQFPLAVRPHVVAVPEGTLLPPIWLLGSSDFSAHLAAQLGMGFGFAAHFSDFEAEGPMLGYRRHFTPGGHIPRPHAILTLSVIAAPTDTEAERLASSLMVAFTRLRTGQSSILLPPDKALAYEFSPVEQSVADSLRDRHIVGAPETVVPLIQDIAARTEADEVMITTFTYGHAERVRSYELLAEAFDLPRAS